MDMKNFHIINIHLSISIKKYDISYIKLIAISTEKFNACFVACAMSAIDQMIDEYNTSLWILILDLLYFSYGCIF